MFVPRGRVYQGEFGKEAGKRTRVGVVDARTTPEKAFKSDPRGNSLPRYAGGGWSAERRDYVAALLSALRLGETRKTLALLVAALQVS